MEDKLREDAVSPEFSVKRAECILVYTVSSPEDIIVTEFAFPFAFVWGRPSASGFTTR